jgi:hypothetical protein
MRSVSTGVTDQTIVVNCFDSDEAAVTLTSGSSGLAISYRVDSSGREGTPVSMTPVARLVAGQHRDGAITSKGDGKHEIDLPDAAFAAAGFVSVILTATSVTGRVYSEVIAIGQTAELDSSVGAQITAIETFATRITTGIVQDGAVWQFTANMLELAPSSSGGDATLANQVEIKSLITGSQVIQVASPNVSGNLVLTQGDDYDGVANPKASWTVTTDYTSGWTVRLTIRDVDDAVTYTTTGTVVSSTVIAVTIAAPTGLTMAGCPGQWQGKFDVELTHSSGKKKTIALGVCYINEDQTR